MIVIRFKLWFEKECKHVMGRGGYEILKAIDEHGSISKASKALGVSYKFVWNYLKVMEENLGVPVVEMRRGGRGKGGTRLTEAGKELVRHYERIYQLVCKALENAGYSTVLICGKYGFKL
jgi:molybdate transport system regulatory protein